ncbi:MAG: hypothetical protein PHH30_11910 [Bacteroidales bacterium]|nr:hypothetical protein [Bacteroidales bacterium]MDD3859604.1 hypothetical protein [Bacteroidales bacterium]
MKNLIFTTVVICLFLVSCGSAKKKLTDLVKTETTETALEYNDDLIAIQSEVDNSIVDLLSVIDGSDPVEMEDARSNTLDIIEDAIKEVEDMRDFDGKDDFKEAMIDLLKMYEDIVKNELTDIIDLVGYTEELTDDDWLKYEELYDSALAKYDEAFVDFDSFQADFADKWDFTVNRD